MSRLVSIFILLFAFIGSSAFSCATSSKKPPESAEPKKEQEKKKTDKPDVVFRPALKFKDKAKKEEAEAKPPLESFKKITGLSQDKDYGRSKHKPIKLGGIGSKDSTHLKYLNSLKGPQGQKLEYVSRGTCCPFSSTEGFINDIAYLDIYDVTYKGADDWIRLYLNRYEFEDALAPVGFSY